MSENATEAAQPPAPSGGGDGASGAQDGSPFAAVLEAVPQGREAVEAALKKVEGGITQRFQEAADFRKQWEPYADMGLSEVPAEQLQEQVALGRLFADPASINPEQINSEALSAAWERIGDHFGFFEDGEPAGGQPAQQQGQGLDPAVQQVIDGLKQQVTDLQQSLEPVLNGYQSQEQERRVQAADEAISTALDKLESEHPGAVNRELVNALAYPYADQGAEKAIELAFRDSQQFTGAIERGMVENKTGQPAPAAGEARPDTTPPTIATFEDAKKAARQRLAALPGT